MKSYLIDIFNTTDKFISVNDTEPESYTEYKFPTYKFFIYKPSTEHES